MEKCTANPASHEKKEEMKGNVNSGRKEIEMKTKHIRVSIIHI